MRTLPKEEETAECYIVDIKFKKRGRKEALAQFCGTPWYCLSCLCYDTDKFHKRHPENFKIHVFLADKDDFDICYEYYANSEEEYHMIVDKIKKWLIMIDNQYNTLENILNFNKMPFKELFKLN